MSIRINKYLSELGYCSRREADKLIAQEAIQINGRIAVIGDQVEDNDVVSVNGVVLERTIPLIYIAFHKPVGITSTTDEKDATNVIDYLKHPHRIFPIGRLDKDSEGLLLLTNDGDIVNKILRSDNNHEKEYIVTVNKPLTSVFLQKMRTGVPILNTVTKPAKVHQLNKFQFRIILTEGMNRQIRRMSSALGYKVIRLVRTRVMNVHLDGIESGKWRDLTESEIAEIRQLVKDSRKTA